MNPTALTGVQIGVLTRFQVAFERWLLSRNRAAGYAERFVDRGLSYTLPLMVEQLVLLRAEVVQ